MEGPVPYSFEKKRRYAERLTLMADFVKREAEVRAADNIIYSKVVAGNFLKECEKAKVEREELERDESNFNVPQECGFFLVVRVRGVNKVSPRVRTILRILRLNKPNHAVFVLNNKPMRGILRIVRNYVAFGTCRPDLVRRLVFRRGTCKFGGRRSNITNEVVDKEFSGEIRCVEEIVHHICNVTPMFKRVNNFLWPFTLSPPRKGFFRSKARDVTQLGSTGDHRDKISELVERMIY